MTELAIIALVVFAVIMSLMIAVYFFRLGQEAEYRRQQSMYYAVSAPEFTRRLPGQEPGYMEELPNDVTYVYERR